MLISVYYLLISNDALERQIVVVAANDVRQYAKYDIPTMSASVNLRTAFVVHYVDLRRSLKNYSISSIDRAEMLKISLYTTI